MFSLTCSFSSKASLLIGIVSIGLYTFACYIFVSVDFCEINYKQILTNAMSSIFQLGKTCDISVIHFTNGEIKKILNTFDCCLTYDIFC